MALLQRFIPMAGIWLVLSANAPSAWAIGLLASVVAVAVSRRLWPAARWRPGVRACLRLAFHFARGSVAGGLDVARRAFDPRLPVRPGWIACSVDLPPGASRKVMGDILSLMPGSMAAGESRGELLVHCLDTGQPVREGVSRLGCTLRDALGRAPARAPERTDG